MILKRKVACPECEGYTTVEIEVWEDDNDLCYNAPREVGCSRCQCLFEINVIASVEVEADI